MTRFGLSVALLLGACGQQPQQNAQGPAPPEPGAAAPPEQAAARPDYLPDYPGATRVEIPSLGGAGPGPGARSGNAIAMETDAAPEDVAAFYRARFAAAGVPVRVDTANAQGGLIAVGRDGDAFGATLTISRIGGKTRIAIMRAGIGR